MDASALPRRGRRRGGSISPAGAIASRKWIEEYAEVVGLSYSAVMDAADEWLEFGQYRRLSNDIPNLV